MTNVVVYKSTDQDKPLSIRYFPAFLFELRKEAYASHPFILNVTQTSYNRSAIGAEARAHYPRAPWLKGGINKIYLSFVFAF